MTAADPPLTADAADLVGVVLAHPLDATPRNALQDSLRDAARWDWPTVNGLVLAHPESDGVRLLAADWLETEGGTHAKRERAEFIRVQVQITRLEHGPCDCTQSLRERSRVCEWCERIDVLRRRERSLFGVHGRGLVGGDWGEFALGCAGMGFRYAAYNGGAIPPPVLTLARGFLATASGQWRTFVRFSDALLAAHPVETVSLTTVPVPMRSGRAGPNPARWAFFHPSVPPGRITRAELDRHAPADRVFRHLAGGPGSVRGKVMWYDRREDAVADLGRAIAAEWPSVKTWTLPPEYRPGVVAEILWDNAHHAGEFQAYVEEQRRLVFAALAVPAAVIGQPAEPPPH